MFLSRGDWDLGVAFQTHPGVRRRLEGKQRTSLSSRVRYFLEPTEWTKGSQASSGVWREDSGLHSRTCRKRRPSSHVDGGVSVVLPSCSASVGLFTRYARELREPLVWRQGSQVSMCMAMGSGSLLSSHGRGIGPQVTLKDSRGFSRVAAETLRSLDFCR